MAAVDRISELPEPILHHILSFLSQNQAIQSSALSKTWRHVGTTLPKIELRERWFHKSGKLSILSVLGKTLQRYYHQNLSVHEFILEMWLDHRAQSVLDKEIPTLLTNMGQVKKFDFSFPHYTLDPSLVFKAEFLTELYLSKCNFMTSTSTNNDPLFKGLKRLSLCQVCVSEETFVQIMLSCRLIEYLLVSDCPGLKTIPELIFQAESLTELHLTGCKLINTTQPLLIKRLKTLSLDHVYIAKDALEEIVCSCPLIEHVILSCCLELETIELIQSHNNDNDKYSFPRLKTLCLSYVNLSAELFESLSSNFPSLEDLELKYCNGFSEIQLTLCLIKRLVIFIDSTERMAISIHAPNIRCFELSVKALPDLIFHTETAREWKSHVVLYSCSNVLFLTWLLQLSELLNSLRESQISLDVFPNSFENLRVKNTNDAIFCKPVPLELVCVKKDIYHSCSFPDFLYCLFLICRPRYIGMNWCGYPTNSIFDVLKHVKNKQAEFIISEMMIRNQQGEMSRGYLWERDLEEISMQLWDEHSNGWHNVRVEGTSFPQFTKIRFPLKWKGS